MSALLDAALCALGADRALRRLRRHDLAVLMYHGLAERALDPFCWHVLDVARFRRQVEWAAARYTVLPLADALDRWRAGTLPERSLALTFDDGYESVVRLGLPILERLGLPATVFLVTEAVDLGQRLWPDRVYAHLAAAGDDVPAIDAALARMKSMSREEKALHLVRLEAQAPSGLRERLAPFRLLTWDDVTRAAAGGLLDFGPHSLTHEILSRCDDHEVVRQVSGSVEAVARHVGRRPRVFAYPNGRLVDFDDRARAAVAAAGLEYALATVPGAVGRTADPYALPRVSIGADLSFVRFRLLV